MSSNQITPQVTVTDPNLSNVINFAKTLSQYVNSLQVVQDCNGTGFKLTSSTDLRQLDLTSFKSMIQGFVSGILSNSDQVNNRINELRSELDAWKGDIEEKEILDDIEDEDENEHSRRWDNVEDALNCEKRTGILIGDPKWMAQDTKGNPIPFSTVPAVSSVPLDSHNRTGSSARPHNSSGKTYPTKESDPVRYARMSKVNQFTMDFKSFAYPFAKKNPYFSECWMFMKESFSPENRSGLANDGLDLIVEKTEEAAMTIASQYDKTGQNNESIINAITQLRRSDTAEKKIKSLNDLLKELEKLQ
jgi:hypothetical protein